MPHRITKPCFSQKKKSNLIGCVVFEFFLFGAIWYLGLSKSDTTSFSIFGRFSLGLIFLEGLFISALADRISKFWVSIQVSKQHDTTEPVFWFLPDIYQKLSFFRKKIITNYRLKIEKRALQHYIFNNIFYNIYYGSTFQKDPTVPIWPKLNILLKIQTLDTFFIIFFSKEFVLYWLSNIVANAKLKIFVNFQFKCIAISFRMHQRTIWYSLYPFITFWLECVATTPFNVWFKRCGYAF
jgi:hypothetical protein